MSSSIPIEWSFPQLLLNSALSTYGLYVSYQNITRLQQYEKQSEKAAEWSSTAAQRLHKTRTTQTSGTLTLMISFLTSTTLVVMPSLASPTVLVGTSLANTAILFASRTHMANFWNESNQTRIPFLKKFNEAVRGSENVVLHLGTLSIAWVGPGIAWLAMKQGLILAGKIVLMVWAVALGTRIMYVCNEMGWSVRA
ncbi:hypothetical protein BKA66DRAFT_463966 [Pyrenochaeta sp. MPI-SDFR-AT-0127]|nr:hypothetical protein BKA66DRAFT_463966 [Pyrenochaeta sp. MPI-SDFR-AT-0127]